jgi:hypothetical protein
MRGFLQARAEHVVSRPTPHTKITKFTKITEP